MLVFKGGKRLDKNRDRINYAFGKVVVKFCEIFVCPISSSKV